MAENNKPETRQRRKRILQQGSDRLAFITGRIPSLPSKPPSPSPSPSPSLPDADAIPNHPNTTLPSILHPQGEAVEEELDSTLLNHDPVDTDPNFADASRSIALTQHRHENEGESEISSIRASEVEHVQVQPPPPDSSLDDIFNQRPPQQQEVRAVESRLSIAPSEISSAINASRITRLCCSVAMALLVVASYLGFSFSGSDLFKSALSFRPLYLVLVTNLTVVVARLICSKKTRVYRTLGGDQWDAQLARMLEFGLVLQNVMDAVFIDCAVYSIIVVCGISLVQT